MIEDSLSRRAHVVNYDQDIIPTKEEIDELLRLAYTLVTSKQKGYPYKIYVLGPNKKRSKKLWQLCEGNKITTDTIAYGDAGDNYRANLGLYHIDSAPWTLIATPRVAPPNPFHRKNFDESKSLWELEDPIFVGKQNRESCAIEVGMLAKAITGAALDRGWDTSYNVCFPKNMNQWTEFPYLTYYPFLIQTLGKATKYKWQTLSKEDSKNDSDPPFETIFEFVDNKQDSHV